VNFHARKTFHETKTNFSKLFFKNSFITQSFVNIPSTDIFPLIARVVNISLKVSMIASRHTRSKYRLTRKCEQEFQNSGKKYFVDQRFYK